jgi:hypothetical protein
VRRTGVQLVRVGAQGDAEVGREPGDIDLGVKVDDVFALGLDLAAVSSWQRAGEEVLPSRGSSCGP